MGRGSNGSYVARNVPNLGENEIRSSNERLIRVIWNRGHMQLVIGVPPHTADDSQRTDPAIVTAPGPKHGSHHGRIPRKVEEPRGREQFQPEQFPPKSLSTQQTSTQPTSTQTYFQPKPTFHPSQLQPMDAFVREKGRTKFLAFSQNRTATAG